MKESYQISLEQAVDADTKISLLQTAWQARKANPRLAVLNAPAFQEVAVNIREQVEALPQTLTEFEFLGLQVAREKGKKGAFVWHFRDSAAVYAEYSAKAPGINESFREILELNAGLHVAAVIASEALEHRPLYG